jgi:hypothetical protein
MKISQFSSSHPTYLGLLLLVLASKDSQIPQNSSRLKKETTNMMTKIAGNKYVDDRTGHVVKLKPDEESGNIAAYELEGSSNPAYRIDALMALIDQTDPAYASMYKSVLRDIRRDYVYALESERTLANLVERVLRRKIGISALREFMEVRDDEKTRV